LRKKKLKRREDMSKQAVEAENLQSIGRIAPLNMASERNGLNYDSMIRDMTTTKDRDDDGLNCTINWA